MSATKALSTGPVYICFQKRVDEVKERLGAELQEAGFHINIKDLLLNNRHGKTSLKDDTAFIAGIKGIAV